MRLTLAFDFPAAARPLVLAAVDMMLRALPNTAKVEITEQRKTVLFGGDRVDDYVSDAITPIEQAIKERTDATT